MPPRLGRALLKRTRSVVTKPAATEPAVTALRRRPLLKSAKIEKLCRGGSAKAEQQHRRNRKRDQWDASGQAAAFRLVGHAL
jgi:hypothetical protein